MKRSLAILFMLVCSAGLAQKAEIIKLNRLQALLETKSDNIQIVNFWATWCAPCVKELPLFEKLHAESRPGIKIALVSMDMDLDPDPEKVYKFISRKNLQSEVFILNEQNANSWINKIEKQWSGALPATIIVNQKTGKRKFIEKELHEGDLEKFIDELQ
ncbi:MAG: TlpA family protein disulfide reductase [Bacteroidota bacterium]